MPDVVVIGAGVAGLAAAAAVRRAGRRSIVIEAGERIGGRAWTAQPAALGGAPIDLGATWLHNADQNPLTAIAQAAGETLIDSDAVREWRTMIGDRAATAGELETYERAWTSFEQTVAQQMADTDGDLSLADASTGFRDDPWCATMLAWEGAIIAAADAADLSARDWLANPLQGRNLMVQGGLGAMIVRRLGPQAGEIRLTTAATRVDWAGPTIKVTTDAGAIEAAACIVTVSTGLLAAGAIRFVPELPAATGAAIAALPMGLATKIAFRAAGPDRLDLPDFTSIDRRIAHERDRFIVFIAWPFGHDHIIGYVGGSAAWELARAGDAAAAGVARAELRALLGADAVRGLAEAAVVSPWGTDPLTRGAYAYVRPGDAGARAALAEPIAGGRLVFAGEACAEGLAGTVGGAYFSGEAAARAALAAIGG